MPSSREPQAERSTEAAMTPTRAPSDPARLPRSARPSSAGERQPRGLGEEPGVAVGLSFRAAAAASTWLVPEKPRLSQADPAGALPLPSRSF